MDRNAPVITHRFTPVDDGVLVQTEESWEGRTSTDPSPFHAECARSIYQVMAGELEAGS